MHPLYGRDFYKDSHAHTLYAAETILSIVLNALPHVQSAIDFGCGVGTWLSVLKKRGVAEIRGIDGRWVDRDLLEIQEDEFQSCNFDEDILVQHRYDLAISLEVIEHLSPESASKFIDSLISASDFVLFSGAIPLQGGVNHINEQWQDHWVEEFYARGYIVLDIVRKRIWNDKKIPVWYRQNVLLFVKRERIQSVEISASEKLFENQPLPVVHPDLFLAKQTASITVQESFGLLRNAIIRWIKMTIKAQITHSKRKKS